MSNNSSKFLLRRFGLLVVSLLTFSSCASTSTNSQTDQIELAKARLEDARQLCADLTGSNNCETTTSDSTALTLPEGFDLSGFADADTTAAPQEPNSPEDSNPTNMGGRRCSVRIGTIGTDVVAEIKYFFDDNYDFFDPNFVETVDVPYYKSNIDCGVGSVQIYAKAFTMDPAYGEYRFGGSVNCELSDGKLIGTGGDKLQANCFIGPQK